MEGFLGTGASRAADINLTLHLLMALALLGGMFLARRRNYRAHGICQTSVMLINLILIARIMLPSFLKQVAPEVPGKLGDSYHLVAFTHAIAGTAAELLGLYVVLVAGTKLIPEGLGFKKYKPWMRATLVLWWSVTLLGVGTYAKWYVGGAQSKTSAPAAAPQVKDRVTVTIQNFSFTPKDVEIAQGTTVEWTDVGGRHTVQADDGSFQSDTLVADGKFAHQFDKPGVYRYFCSFHGAMGGQDMAGTITVKAK